MTVGQKPERPDELRRKVAQLPRLGTREQEALLSRIVALGDDALPFLGEMLCDTTLPVYGDVAIGGYACLGERAVPDLVILMRSYGPDVAERAAEALRRIGTDEATMALREAGIRGALAATGEHGAAGAVVVALVCLGVALALIVGLARSANVDGGAAVVGTVMCVVVAAALYAGVAHGEHRARGSARRAAIRALCARGSMEHLDTLARCLEDDDQQVRDAASTALVPLLPRATEADRGRLTPDGLAALLKVLMDDNDEELAVPLLHAMAVLGDRRALQVVEPLAGTPGSRYDSVRRAAGECLAELTARLAREAEADLLVRASTPESEHTLVRPAGGGDGEIALLLRPGSDETGGTRRP